MTFGSDCASSHWSLPDHSLDAYEFGYHLQDIADAVQFADQDWANRAERL
jgi:hypothetical protein